MTERVLSNRYVLYEVIGMGGMAVVYRAWDRVQLREVAVKVLRSEYNADDEFIRRFNHEAHAASQMSHPNIVNMYDVGQDGDMRYIVMECVRGRTLKDVIRQAGRIKPQRAVQMALRILAAVDHAHKNHIVHRDIKPQNILVDAEGNIKVADFGIARVTNANTQTMGDGESVLGSVHYFSPEQASGQTADEKSDLYSVGVVLYEMVTGQVPFDGDSAVAVALKHVQEVPKSTRLFAPDVSKGLDEVILKSLEKDADKRYQTAADFANDLKRAIRTPRGGFVGNLSQAEQQLKKQERKERRQRTLKRVRNYLLFALAVAVLVLGVVYGSEAYRYFFGRINCPDVTLINIEQADSELKALGIRYTTEERHDEDVHRGTVLNQSPGPGTPMWPGERVQLVISKGKEKLMMPKLLELTHNEAAKVIEQNDLFLPESNVTLVVSEAPIGRVVQQEPAVNDWVKPGDNVKIWISGDAADMPSTIGKPLEEGKELLISSGFQVGNVIEKLAPDVQAGTIIEQGIEPGSQAVLGAMVQLVISQATTPSYRARKDFDVLIPEGGAEVYCTVDGNGIAIEQFRARYDKAGNQRITVDLDMDQPGQYALRVYVNDEMVIEDRVEVS